jgi:hypothetical protein
MEEKKVLVVIGSDAVTHHDMIQRIIEKRVEASEKREKIFRLVCPIKPEELEKLREYSPLEKPSSRAALRRLNQRWKKQGY